MEESKKPRRFLHGLKVFDKTIKFWNGPQLGRTNDITALAVDASGALLACGSQNGFLRVIDVDEYVIFDTLSKKDPISPVLEIDLKSPISSIVWSIYDHDVFAVTFFYSLDVHIIDLNTFPSTLKLSTGLVQGGHDVAVFLPPSKFTSRIIAGSSKGMLSCWDWPRQRRLWEVRSDPFASVHNLSPVTAILAVDREVDRFCGQVITLNSQGIITLWNVNQLTSVSFGCSEQPTFLHRLSLSQHLSSFREEVPCQFVTLVHIPMRSMMSFVASTNLGEIVEVALDNDKLLPSPWIPSPSLYFSTLPPLKKVQLIDVEGRSNSLHEGLFRQHSPQAFFQLPLVSLLWHSGFQKLLFLSLFDDVSFPTTVSTATASTATVSTVTDMAAATASATSVPKKTRSDTDPISLQLSLRRCLSTSLTLPGYILDVDYDSHEMYLSQSLTSYLIGQNIASFFPNRSFEIEIHDPGRLRSSQSLVTTVVIDSVSDRRICLKEPYIGPKVKDGIPKLLLRTCLEPISNELKVPKTSSPMPGVSDSKGIDHRTSSSRNQDHRSNHSLSSSAASTTPSTTTATTSTITSSSFQLLPASGSLVGCIFGVGKVQRELSFPRRVYCICTHPTLPLAFLGLENHEICVVGL